MESTPDEVVVVVQRYKLRNNAFTTIGKKNIVVNVESHYTRGRRPVHILKSPEQRAVPGCTVYVPWADTIVGLVLNVHAIQDRLTCFLGQAEVTTEYFGTQPTKLDLYIKNCGEVVGTISVSVFVRQIFMEQCPPAPAESALKIQKPVDTEEIGPYCVPTPDGFRFNRLARPVNWERLRSINLRRVAENTDVSSLTAALDDVLTGDVGDEEVDPRLAHALQTAQLTAQYIVAGNRLLKSKQATIERGIAAFDDEEDRLDLQLSKLRAKCRARQREADDLDALELKYNKLLKYCDPKLASAHRKEEKRQKMREEYEREKRDRRSRGNQLNVSRNGGERKTKAKNDDSVRSSDGSLAAEDKSNAGSGYGFNWRESAAAAAASADEKPEDTQADISVDTDVGVTPKLLELKPVTKEEPFRRFHVIKKPDVPIENVEWTNARQHTKPTVSAISPEKSIPIHTDDQENNFHVGKRTQIQNNMGTMASSTVMSVDSLLRTADTATVSPDCGADSGGSSPETKQEPVNKIAAPPPWVSAAIAVKVAEPDEDVVVPFSPTDVMQSPTIAAKVPRREHKVDENSHDPPDRKVTVHPSALESSMEITELGQDIIMSPDRNSAMGGASETGGHQNHENVSGNAVDVDVSLKIKDDDDVLQDFTTSVSSQDRRSVVSNWGRPEKYTLEMQEHENLFAPTASFERIPAESPAGIFTEAFPPTQEEPKVTGSGAPITEMSVGASSEHSDSEEANKAADGDMLSPLGVVGTAILRRRAAGGVGSSSVASDEDDRVLMGTLHHYDSTGAISMDTSDQSMNSSTQFEISEDPNVCVPVKDPPAPPTLRISPAGDEPIEQDSRSPPMSALATADSSVGFEVNAVDNFTEGKSFGEESSEINMSQGFVDTLAARYLDPTLLAETAGDIDAENETGGVPEHGELPMAPDDIADEEEEIIRWNPGRASLDLIETAMAVDAYASSIRLDSEYLRSTQINKIHLRFNFLEATSASSPPISGNVRDSSTSISMNFGAHIEFDRKGFKMLADEIENERDELALQVIVFGEIQRSDDEDDIEDKVIGIASVNMWFMIEDSCAIVLQEVDIVDVDLGIVIGTIVVDVRGHFCLMECS